MNKKYAFLVEDIPDSEFYAILKPKSTLIPGDERSRTNPGHGYPERTEQSWDIEVFLDEEDWKKEIIRLSNQTGYIKEKFKAIRATSPKITTETKVEIQ